MRAVVPLILGQGRTNRAAERTGQGSYGRRVATCSLGLAGMVMDEGVVGVARVACRSKMMMEGESTPIIFSPSLLLHISDKPILV